MSASPWFDPIPADGSFGVCCDADHFHNADDPEDLLIDHGFPVPDAVGEGAATPQEAPVGTEVLLGTIPVLHSKLGAKGTLYLDFDGHYEASWGGYSNISTPVYSVDGDTSTFNASEVAAITEVWKRVSEDYAPFDLDVTTVNPNDFGNGKAMRISIGGTGSWTGGNYGGVGYLNSFTNYLPNTVYVFSNNLSNHARYIAEAASHEAGHGFGLQHQSSYDGSGNKLQEYHPGNASWAPIMGVSYSAAQSLWHNGTSSTGAYVYQDDLAVISNGLNGFGYRTDDHSSSLGSSTQLTVSNGQVSGAGIIEQGNDWDVFSFQSYSTGSVSLTANVMDVGANLDVRIDLYDSQDQLIATADPGNSLSASLSQTLAAGSYKLVVRSSGGYGELGQYSISGTVPANHAPVLSAISNQSMSHNQDSVVVALSASDADGDSISYSAQAHQIDATTQLAYQLDQEHDFYAAASEAYNLRGAGEKYLQGKNGAWFFVLSDGRLYRWNSTIANSTLLGTLDSSYHTTVSKLFNVQAPQSSAVDVSLSISGGQLTINPGAQVSGQFTVSVTATDGISSDVKSFQVEVTNHAPELAAIANQSMAPSQDQMTLNLSATDADGDTITYTATAVQLNATAQLAYELDQQQDFYAAPSESYNLRGAGEKYLQGKGGAWFFMLADGKLYRWNNSIANSTLMGTLDSSFHTQVSKLFNVQAPQSSSANVNLSFSGNQLTIDPASGFVGQFTVTVTATDGAATDTQTFEVDVKNHAPVLGSISKQSMTPSQDKLVVNLSATDSDGDTITYTATAVQVDSRAQLAYELDQQHDFYAAASEAYNCRGAGEKYLQGKGGAWFFILADGRLYRWNSSIANSTLLGTLDSSYHATVSKLFNVQAPQITTINVGLSFTGGQLTIDPAGGFTGEFTVTVTATDGTDSDAESFQVEVINHAPQLAAIANQSMTPSQDTLVLNLTATDADGDAISFSATAVQVDTAAQLAYTLDQQYDFFAASSEAHNLRGAGEKYLQGKGGAWYFILADGRLYRWNTTIADGTLLGTLNGSYHTSVSKLFNVQAPQATSVNVGLTFDGSQLTVDPAAGLTGQFSVTVTATDGTASDVKTFSVDVTNHAPELPAIGDRTMGLAQDTLVVNVSATDADGDSITYSATAVQRNATAQLAYELDQQYDFFAAGSEAYNLRGAGEKYLQGKGGAWYFILSDGRLYRWNSSIANSTLLGTLDSSYHTTVSKLFNVQAPTSSAVNVGLTFNGGQLTIDPASGFSGQFTVTVTASDGAESDQQSFHVLIANSAPQIATIGDQSMSAGQDTLVLNLSVTDADGDSISYTASAYQVNAAVKLAYELDQQYDFYAAGSEAHNLRGAGEKYLQGKGGAWYFILADGRLYKWNSTIANGTLLGTLDSSYHTTLSKLYNVQAAQQTSVNVGLSFNGSQFTIDPANGVNGTFTVTVTASDGSLTDAETFQVTIANAAPVFAPLGSTLPNRFPESGDASILLRATDVTAEPLGTYLASWDAWQTRQYAPEPIANGVTSFVPAHRFGQIPRDSFAATMFSRSAVVPVAAELHDAVVGQIGRRAADSCTRVAAATDDVREQDALTAVFEEWGGNLEPLAVRDLREFSVSL